MRSFKHWTPRYIFDRLNTKAYERIYPDHPWLTKTANGILAFYLKDSDVGFEFGSGRSTLWLARRICLLTSVEHDRVWYARIRKQLEREGISNVKYYLREEAKQNDQHAQSHAYTRVIEACEECSLDFVLIDGLYRDICAYSALTKLRPGGLVVIDNADWFLPCRSRSPSSRRPEDGPVSELWKEFLYVVKDWRLIWTSNGVCDTAFYFRPCSRI